MFQKIKEKPFWVHVLIIIGLVVILLFGFLQLLGIITKHGDYLTVPAVVNTSTADAVKLLESKGFDVVIRDSVYTDTAKMGIVLKQFPDANSTVKVNRVVMLTVNRVTLPMVDMPALEGKSLNYAMEILSRSHLVLGDTTFRNDYAQGAVLEQHFKGSLVKSGDKVPWGSHIDLIVGAGLSENRRFPCLLYWALLSTKQKVFCRNRGLFWDRCNWMPALPIQRMHLSTNRSRRNLRMINNSVLSAPAR